MIRAVLPEILLVVLAVIVLVYDLVVDAGHRRSLGWLTVGGLAVIFFVSLALARPGAEPQQVWGGMLRHDWLGFVFTLLFLFGAAVTSLFARDVWPLGPRGEVFLFLGGS